MNAVIIFALFLVALFGWNAFRMSNETEFRIVYRERFETRNGDIRTRTNVASICALTESGAVRALKRRVGWVVVVKCEPAEKGGGAGVSDEKMKKIAERGRAIVNALDLYDEKMGKLNNFFDEIDSGGEKCQRCGKRYLTVYHVPDDVWAKIRPNKHDPDGDLYGGLLCPSCADALARNIGIILYWEPSVGDWSQNKKAERIQR